VKKPSRPLRFHVRFFEPDRQIYSIIYDAPVASAGREIDRCGAKDKQTRLKFL